MDVVVGIAQTVLAVVALYVGWKALKISEAVQQDSARERKRADLRDRLMWMQTILNAVPGISDARAADEEKMYVDRQRWILTGLAVAGLRDELPETGKLAERPFTEPWAGMIDLRDRARIELHSVLEHAGDRAYAGEKIGQ